MTVGLSYIITRHPTFECISHLLFNNIQMKFQIVSFLFASLLLAPTAQTPCDSGFYLSSNSTCIPCSEDIPNCSQCQLGKDKTPICTKCRYSTLSADGLRCVPCDINNCLQCNDSDARTCVKCQPPFQLQSVDDGAVKCGAPSCPPPATVFNGVNCTCLEGMTLVSRECKQCKDLSCLSCSAVDKCQKCMVKYYVDANGKCSKCSENCMICLSQLKCLFCQEGAFLSYKTYECGSVEPRTVVAFAFYTDTKSKILCPQLGCGACSQDGGQCINCLVGYTMQQKQCVQCADGCIQCNQKTKCLRCYDQHSMQEGICIRCKDMNCLHCEGNPNFCTQCSIFTTNSIFGECKQCSQNCLTCQKDKNKCTQCLDGYFLSQNSSCLPCLMNYYLCSTLIPVDTPCKSSYAQVNGRCVPCGVGCLSCSNHPNHCDSCVSGYNVEGNRCAPRVFLPCTDFTINSNEPTKALVVECSACLIGYVNVNSVCDDSKMRECEASNSCTVCPLGKMLENSKCVQCPANCQLCTGVGCSKCLAGYYLSQDMCRRCALGCSYCENSNQCARCFEGYYLLIPAEALTLRVCVRCGSNCRQCSSNPYHCYICEKGYVMEGGHCYLENSVQFSLSFADRDSVNKIMEDAPEKFMRSISQSVDDRVEYSVGSIVLTSINEGNVKGKMLAGLKDTDTVALSNMKKIKEIMGIKVFWNGIQKIKDNQDKDNKEDKEKDIGNEFPLAIIIGSLAGAVALIGVGVGIYCCCKSKVMKSDKIEEEYEMANIGSGDRVSPSTEMLDSPQSASPRSIYSPRQ